MLWYSDWIQRVVFSIFCSKISQQLDDKRIFSGQGLSHLSGLFFVLTFASQFIFAIEKRV